MTHPVTSYALDAVTGSLTVGTPERQACLRHLHDLARAGQLDKVTARRIEKATGSAVPDVDPSFPWMFDEKQASFVAIDWFAHLHHTEGRLVGQPIELCPASVFDIGCIFGWTSHTPHPSLTRKNGRKVGIRRFRKAMRFVARKNAKTTEGSGIQLYGMIGDRESNPRCYCAAVDKQQAREMYEKAKLMAENSSDVSKWLKIRDYRISHRELGGALLPLSKETKNKDGLNPSFVFIDEYHAHPTSEIYDLISSAKGQRLQPLMFIITTAGGDVEAPCYEELEYCRKVVSGAVPNDRYFVMIRELDKDDDEHDPANWIKANPLLCSTPEGLAELQEMHNEAFDSGISEKINTFRIKNLNKWVHGANRNSYLTDEQMTALDACGIPRAEFDELTKGMTGLVGVDLSMREDLTACSFVFALDDGRVALTAHGFMPEESVRRHEKTDKIPYRYYANEGWLTITEGEVVDFNVLEDYIERAEEQERIIVREICYDPYNATQIANNLAAKGYENVFVRQGKPSLSEPTKLLRQLIISGKLIHDGSPLLRTHFANAVLEVDSNENIKITKEAAKETKRIDLVAASITALFRLPALREALSSGDLEGIGF